MTPTSCRACHGAPFRAHRSTVFRYRGFVAHARHSTGSPRAARSRDALAERQREVADHSSRCRRVAMPISAPLVEQIANRCRQHPLDDSATLAADVNQRLVVAAEPPQEVQQLGPFADREPAGSAMTAAQARWLDDLHALARCVGPAVHAGDPQGANAAGALMPSRPTRYA